MQLAQLHLQTVICCSSHQHPFPEGPSPYLEPSSYARQAWDRGMSLVKTRNMPGLCVGSMKLEKHLNCQIYFGVIISSVWKTSIPLSCLDRNRGQVWAQWDSFSCDEREGLVRGHRLSIESIEPYGAPTSYPALPPSILGWTGNRYSFLYITRHADGAAHMDRSFISEMGLTSGWMSIRGSVVPKCPPTYNFF